MVTVRIGRELQETLDSQNLQQKEIAIDCNTPFSTFSDHVKNKPCGLDKALSYSGAIRDSKFNLSLSYKILGLFKAIDGSTYQDSPLALDILQRKESDERKACKENVELILAKNKDSLTNDDRETLKGYMNEFLDEILVEISLVTSILKLLGITLMQAIAQRMTKWQSEGLIRRD